MLAGSGSVDASRQQEIIVELLFMLMSSDGGFVVSLISNAWVR
jgi:hypothetical protein